MKITKDNNLVLGDKVKLKYNSTHGIGMIVGIWDKTEYIIDNEGNSKLLASKGDYKVSFDNDLPSSYQTFSGQLLIKL